MELKLSRLEARTHLELLNRLFEMGSYDYVFPRSVDELRAEKIRKELVAFLEGENNG